MPMDAREIEGMIKAAIPDATVEIKDLAGDGDHYAATVISAAFKGKTPRPAAPDGLFGPARPHGRRAARACADDGRAAGLSSPAQARGPRTALSAAVYREGAAAAPVGAGSSR